MLLAEKYAEADLNAIKHYERAEGIEEGETRIANEAKRLLELGDMAKLSEFLNKFASKA